VLYVVKRNITIAALVLFSSVSAYFAASFFGRSSANIATFDKQEGIKIAVLDGLRLKKEAKCFMAHDEIAEMVADSLSRIKKSEEEIKEQYEKLRANKKLSKRQLAAESSKLEMKWSKIAGQCKAEMLTIREKEAALINLIQKKVEEVTRSVAKQLDLNIVINKSVGDFSIVLYDTHNVEITDYVIQKLDEELPNVDLEKIKND
jgi:Skp family chaperone for outer membrane proteins